MGERVPKDVNGQLWRAWAARSACCKADPLLDTWTECFPLLPKGVLQELGSKTGPWDEGTQSL